MSAAAPSLEDLARGVNRVRRGVLGIVAVSGLLLFTRGTADPTPLAAATDAGVTTVVVCLALGAIVLRQVASRRAAAPRTRVRALVGTYLCAGALALTGLALGLATGDRRRGLAYALAAAIFSLGRPGLAAPALPKGRS
jgi:hypothetical protein